MTAVVGISFLPQAAEASDGDDVTLRLKWLHQAQFAGPYTAEQKGFYHDNGIDITINPGGIDFPAIQMIAGGGDMFGVTGGDQILLAREKEVPIVAIAVIYRGNPFVMFALESSGISEPKDFIGKTIGVQPGANEELMYRAMMANEGIDTALLTEESVRFDITPLLTGMVDVWPGYAINQPITAEEKGFPVNLIWPSDYGVELYADTLFTTEDLIKNNPDLVKRFVSATMQGWNYAYNNVDEVVGYTLMYSDVLTREHETSMMKASLQSLKPTDRPIGPMDREMWVGMQALLLDNGFMDNAIDIDKVFTNEFLPTAQAAGVSKVALVTDALLSDQGWGTAAYNAIIKVQAKYGFELGTAEGVAVPDIESTLRDFAERDFDLIIAHGFQWSDPSLVVAKDYPNTKIVVFTGFTSGPGVASIFPMQQEGTFPLGALAAMMSKTGVVGFVGGEPYPNLINIVEGYKAGAMYINPDVKVIISWTGDWDDPAKGREAANAQIAQGADVLFHTADTAGHGMIRAAQDKGLYAFGAVLDQWELAPDTVLSSFVLDIEKSFDMAYVMTNEGKFREEMIKPGIETGPGGPGDGIVYLAPFHELSDDVPQDVKNRLDAIITDIQSGRLVIPETYEFTAEGVSALTVVESIAAAEVVEPAAEGGGCLIATAAFGSEMAPQVQLLREIRDNTILQTESGSAFMTGFNQFYYSFSPAIADYERENPAFKETVKLTLTPLLASLTLLQYADIDSESEMLGYGISVILLNIGMYFVAPTVLVMAVRKKIINK